MHHLTKVFCLLALISLASHASLYLSFRNFTESSGFPFSQIFGSLYHKDISNGTWSYLNHFTCQTKGGCWERICQASSYPRTNEICLTPVTTDSPTCHTRQSLPKSATFLIEFLLVIELLYFPFCILRDGPFSWNKEEARVRLSYRFIVWTSIFTTIVLVVSTSIFLLTLDTVTIWVWVNHANQSLILCVIIIALFNQPPVIEEEDGKEENPLILERTITIQ